MLNIKSAIKAHNYKPCQARRFSDFKCHALLFVVSSEVNNDPFEESSECISEINIKFSKKIPIHIFVSPYKSLLCSFNSTGIPLAAENKHEPSNDSVEKSDKHVPKTENIDISCHKAISFQKNIINKSPISAYIVHRKGN